MAHERVVVRDPFGRSPRRPDAPDVHPVGHETLDEVDEGLVRRPDGEVRVQARRGGEDLARLGLAASRARTSDRRARACDRRVRSPSPDQSNSATPSR